MLQHPPKFCRQITVLFSFLVLLSKKKHNLRLQLLSLLLAKAGPADTSKAQAKFLNIQSVWISADEAIQEGKNKTKVRL